MNNQIHNTRSAQYIFFIFYFLSPCRTNTSTVYIQVPKFYNSLNEWMDGWMDGWMVGWMNGWMEGGRERGTNERTTE